MTKTYHTWRQDAKDLESNGWELTATGPRCAKGAWAEWVHRDNGQKYGTSGNDIVDAIRAATRMAVKGMEELNAEAIAAQEKPT